MSEREARALRQSLPSDLLVRRQGRLRSGRSRTKMSEGATDDNAGHGTVLPRTQDPVEEQVEMVQREATPETDVQQLLEQMAHMRELLSN